jgi:DNA-binding transcriptional LysR family regulator
MMGRENSAKQYIVLTGAIVFYDRSLGAPTAQKRRGGSPPPMSWTPPLFARRRDAPGTRRRATERRRSGGRLRSRPLPADSPRHRCRPRTAGDHRAAPRLGHHPRLGRVVRLHWPTTPPRSGERRPVSAALARCRGFATAILPRSITALEGPAIEVKRLHPAVRLPVALVWRRDRSVPPAARTFIEFVRRETAASG